MDDDARLILRMIEQCGRGESFPWDVLASLERRSDLPRVLASAVHELHHFADDEDIRDRDPEYADYWKQRLEEVRADVARMLTP